MTDHSHGNSPENLVASAIPAYNEMKEHWELVQTLKGGTLAMRKAGTKYLPQESKETETDYANRITRSVLFNGYSKARAGILTKPFSRKVTIQTKDKMPERLQGIEGDADLAGKSLHDLAAELMGSAIDFGKVHAIVDFPEVQSGTTLAQELESGARPYFIPITSDNLIGWRVAKVGGRKILTQIRIKFSKDEESGSFGVVSVNFVKVWTMEDWVIWRQDPKTQKWAMQGEPTPHSFGSIPLFTANINEKRFMVSTPALEDLAWTNQAHWQSDSDQNNLLRFARVGMWFIAGMTDDEINEKGGITLAGAQLVNANDHQADMKVVEHSGSAIEAGRTHGLDLEERMELLGMQPFVRSSGNQTATAKAIDEGGRVTDIQSWIESIETLIESLYKAAAKWINVELPEDFEVNIWSEFGIGLKASDNLDKLIKLRLAGECTAEFFWSEAIRYGLVSDMADAQTISEDARNMEDGFNDDDGGGGGDA